MKKCLRGAAGVSHLFLSFPFLIMLSYQSRFTRAGVGRLPATHEDGGSEISSNFDGEEGDELGSLQSFSDDDAKTRFTNYSMSSSVIRRNKGLTLIDDKFEQVNNRT